MNNLIIFGIGFLMLYGIVKFIDWSQKGVE